MSKYVVAPWLPFCRKPTCRTSHGFRYRGDYRSRKRLDYELVLFGSLKKFQIRSVGLILMEIGLDIPTS